MQVPVFAGWLFALWSRAVAAAEVDNMLVDDACADDEGECGLSLRQLRGELRMAEADAHREEDVPALVDAKQDGLAQNSEGENLDEIQDARGEEQAELNLLALADTDGDGEVQHAEAVHFVEGLRKHSDDDSLALFQAQDTDSSKGLSGQEFAEALEAWGGGCTTHHVATYCSGGHRTCCCHQSWGWASCGCSGHHYSSCGGGGGGYYGGGGYHSGGSYHYHTPYGSSGGGYHSGPYGTGGYHYHTR